jgi:LPS sulfotransferase NodH
MSDLRYFIAITGRSGSTWLCRLLQETGLAGEPDELPRKGAGWEGILKRRPVAVKLPIRTMRRVYELDPSVVEARYVRLEREDKRRQAISYYRARVSNVYHFFQGKGRVARAEAKHRRVEFNPVGILRMYRAILRQEEAWERWLGEKGIEPYRLTYERLTEDPLREVNGILGFLGVGTYAGFFSQSMRILRDEITEEWVERMQGRW